MAFSRFASLNTEEISTLLSEKDSIRTKRATKQFKGNFELKVKIHIIEYTTLICNTRVSKIIQQFLKQQNYCKHALNNNTVPHILISSFKSCNSRRVPRLKFL